MGTLPSAIQTAGLQPSSYGLIWPVANPVVTTEFGDSTFAESFHRGIDLAQNLYTPVLAAADGIVLLSGLAVPGEPSRSYGMRVVIAHGTTLATLYAHLDDTRQTATVKAGDRVKRGQIIGYIGMTGITSGPHLHFEVQVSGEAKNPRLYLPK
jgi:murein DD-endopeptidase MepM/ murein hydrolase activator NlpD